MNKHKGNKVSSRKHTDSCHLPETRDPLWHSYTERQLSELVNTMYLQYHLWAERFCVGRIY